MTIAEQLRSGVIVRTNRWSGDTHADVGGAVDESATNALMAAGADEIDRLTAALAGEWSNARLLHAMPVGNGAFEFAIRSSLSGLIAEHLLDVLKALDAPNYVQMEASHPEVGPITFTIEKRRGRSPAAQLADANDEIDRLTKERDEADRAAGAAARRIAYLEDNAVKRSSWLYEAKRAAGYTDITSFDDVWAEALAALLERRAALDEAVRNIEDTAAQAQGDSSNDA